VNELTGLWKIEIKVTGDPEKEIQVIKDVNIFEILSLTFEGVDIPADEKVKVVVKPLRMQDGAIFRVERVKTIAKLALGIMIWDGTVVRCGIEASPNATIAEMVREAHERLEEPLED
jgi:hypothetical protein